MCYGGLRVCMFLLQTRTTPADFKDQFLRSGWVYVCPLELHSQSFLEFGPAGQILRNVLEYMCVCVSKLKLLKNAIKTQPKEIAANEVS